MLPLNIVTSQTDLPASAAPLCVDLDGTLTLSDLSFESLCQFMKRRPFQIWRVLFWLLRGRAHLKRQLAVRTTIRIDLLPFNQELLKFLREERQRGRELYLVSASDIILVRQVAEHLGLFAGVVGSEGAENLGGARKARVLCERFGKGRFGYAGNAAIDLAVWRAAGEVIVVSDSAALRRRVRREFPAAREFSSSGTMSLKAVLRAIRVHQWLKNILLFLPLLLSHRVFERDLLPINTVAFLAFSFMASAVYLINDLFDLEADREHPRKRSRPLAAGTLPARDAALLIAGLAASAVAIASALPEEFAMCLGAYFLVTLAYSLYLKQLMIVDIITLASLYTLRIFAGGMSVDLKVSDWALVFSMFFFLSLACVKRYSELLRLRRSKRTIASGRGYLAGDLEQIGQFGTSSAYVSILVLALYVTSAEVTALYPHPAFLWFCCPLVLYWISRLWLLAHRGRMHDDPVVFALTDRMSYAVGLTALLFMLLGKYF